MIKTQTQAKNSIFRHILANLYFLFYFSLYKLRRLLTKKEQQVVSALQITLDCAILKLFNSIIGELFRLWENSNTSKLKKKLTTQGKNSVFRHIHMLALWKRWPNYKPDVSPSLQILTAQPGTHTGGIIFLHTRRPLILQIFFWIINNNVSYVLDWHSGKQENGTKQ